ncbi:MAG: hypothetical protein KY428_05685 [Bacteroidetes bacterium]|nr:hypothetical protein [Bacteroidota bacterium]
MVEVFKTNVRSATQAKKVMNVLLLHFPESQINFDLEDCDKVLRVEAEVCNPEKVMLLVQENGFACYSLE